MEHPQDRYFPLANGFIFTSSWDDAKLFVQRNPALLDPEAGTVLQEIADVQPNEEAQNVVLIHKLALELCRERGLEAAFSEILEHEELRSIKEYTLQKVDADKFTQLIDLLTDFMSANDVDGQRRLLDSHPELLSDLASSFIAKMVENAPNEARRQAIARAESILIACRELGIDAAMALQVTEELAAQAARLFTPKNPSGLTVHGWKTQDVFDFIDKLNEQVGDPANIDVQLLQSSALRYAMQSKTAEDIIDLILNRQPEQFDAKLIKEAWGTWPHILELPPCSVPLSRLHPILESELSKRSVMLVRDGIRVGVALILNVEGFQFGRPLTQSMRCKWEFFLSETPYGRIVAHYPFVEVRPQAPFIKELILTTDRPEVPNAHTGYWLLQRLARLTNALIILTAGQEVVYSHRLVFPKPMRAKLEKIAAQIAEHPTRTHDFNAAVKWHSENFDISSLTF